MAGCVSCRRNLVRGRAAHRKVRNGVETCGDCAEPVCRLHANRDDGVVRCRECAQKKHREFTQRLQAGDL